MSFGGITQQIDEFGTAVETISRCRGIRIVSVFISRVQAFGFVRGMSAACSYRSKFFQSGYFQPPAFVVREMEMKCVKFIRCSDVYQLFQILCRGEVPDDVEHLSAVQEVGIVADRDCLQSQCLSLSFQHCQQGLCSVEDAMRCLPFHDSLSVVDVQFVILVVWYFLVFGKIFQ